MWRDLLIQAYLRSRASLRTFFVLGLPVLGCALGITLVVGIAPALADLKRAAEGGAPARGRGDLNVDGFVRVIDGDTIETWIDGKRVGIGLIGIDAPQGNTDCGRRATARLRALVRDGLRLEEDTGLVADQRQRRLFYVNGKDGKSLASELVRDGLVRTNSRGKERQRLSTLESQSRSVRGGCLWDARATGEDAAPGLDTPFMALTLGGDESTVGPSPVARAMAAPPPTVLPNGFIQEDVVGGFSEPTAFTFLPDGRILIAEKRGTVRVFKNGLLLPVALIDIQAQVNDYWDHGLLGMAADPGFASNGFLTCCTSTRTTKPRTMDRRPAV